MSEFFNYTFTEGILVPLEDRETIDFLKDTRTQLREALIDRYEPNKLAQQTEFSAIVLTQITDNTSTAEKIIKVIARIPQIHSLLPIPENANDWPSISCYPVFVGSIGDLSAHSKINNLDPGTVIAVTFENMSNFAGPRVVRIIDINKADAPETDSEITKRRRTARIDGAGSSGPSLQIKGADPLLQKPWAYVHNRIYPFGHTARSWSGKLLFGGEQYAVASGRADVIIAAAGPYGTTDALDEATNGKPAFDVGYTTRSTAKSTDILLITKPGEIDALKRNINKLAALYDVVHLYWSLRYKKNQPGAPGGKVGAVNIKKIVSTSKGTAFTPYSHEFKSQHKYGTATDYRIVPNFAEIDTSKTHAKIDDNARKNLGFLGSIDQMRTFIGFLKLGIAGVIPATFGQKKSKNVMHGGGFGLYFLKGSENANAHGQLKMMSKKVPKGGGKSPIQTQWQKAQDDEDWEHIISSRTHYDFRHSNSSYWVGLAGNFVGPKSGVNVFWAHKDEDFTVDENGDYTSAALKTWKNTATPPEKRILSSGDYLGYKDSLTFLDAMDKSEIKLMILVNWERLTTRGKKRTKLKALADILYPEITTHSTVGGTVVTQIESTLPIKKAYVLAHEDIVAQCPDPGHLVNLPWVGAIYTGEVLDVNELRTLWEKIFNKMNESWKKK